MKKLYVVKDLAANDYNIPVFLKHNNEALRLFRDEANNTESPIGKHPADYELWYIADYNEETAMFTNHENMERLARAIDLLNTVTTNDINPGV